MPLNFISPELFTVIPLFSPSSTWTSHCRPSVDVERAGKFSFIILEISTHFLIRSTIWMASVQEEEKIPEKVWIMHIFHKSVNKMFLMSFLKMWKMMQGTIFSSVFPPPPLFLPPFSAHWCKIRNEFQVTSCFSSSSSSLF